MPASEQVNLNTDVPSDFAEGTKELTEGQRAQIKMTYWVLGGALGLLLISGCAYIFTDNGLHALAEDIKPICLTNTKGELVAFCSKYISGMTTRANFAAKEFFDFCKNFVPPVVTLVLGAHYVTKSTEN